MPLSTLGLTMPDLSSVKSINEQMSLLQEAKVKATFTQNALMGSFLTTGVIQFTFSASRRADAINSDRSEGDDTSQKSKVDPYNAIITCVYGTIMLGGTFIASQIRAYDLILIFLAGKKSMANNNDAISQHEINAYMHNQRLIPNAIRSFPCAAINSLYVGTGFAMRGQRWHQ